MWVLTLQPGLNQHHSTLEGNILTTGLPWKFLQFLLESYSYPVFAKLQLVFMEAILFFKLLSHMDISQQASQTEEWFSQFN